MARTLSERLRAHEQRKACLAEAELKQRIRRLIEAGALVDKSVLLDRYSNVSIGVGCGRLLRADRWLENVRIGPIDFDNVDQRLDTEKTTFLQGSIGFWIFPTV